MRKVLVTGSEGFVGKNLVVALREQKDVEVLTLNRRDTEQEFRERVNSADVIFHLAGVNRPSEVSDFAVGNRDLVKKLIEVLTRSGRTPLIVLSSSTQVAISNPYGRSKKEAEELLEAFGRQTGAPFVVYRLPNVFGKWSRPFYNSVVATFCYQSIMGQELTVTEPQREINFLYIDDLIQSFLQVLADWTIGRVPTDNLSEHGPTYVVTLGRLADLVTSFWKNRSLGVIPDFQDLFVKKLYSTWLSFLPPDDFAYKSLKKEDQRGWLFELLKSPALGQVFVSKTQPGFVRGNHYHHTKVEKFCVVSGVARIAFSHKVSGETTEYLVNGEECRVVDIPPGWSHSIANIGTEPLITLFWANEVFDNSRPDTFHSEVP